MVDEKLGIEYPRAREIPSLLTVSAAARELKVRARYPGRGCGV